MTTLHVTHDQGEALALGHRVAVLRDGRRRAARDAGRGLGAPGERVGGALRRHAADEPRARDARAGRASAPRTRRARVDAGRRLRVRAAPSGSGADRAVAPARGRGRRSSCARPAEPTPPARGDAGARSTCRRSARAALRSPNGRALRERARAARADARAVHARRAAAVHRARGLLARAGADRRRPADAGALHRARRTSRELAERRDLRRGAVAVGAVRADRGAAAAVRSPPGWRCCCMPARAARAGRTAAFLPSVVPDAAWAMVWLFLLNPIYGPVNWLLGAGRHRAGLVVLGRRRGVRRDRADARVHGRRGVHRRAGRAPGAARRAVLGRAAGGRGARGTCCGRSRCR